MGKRCKGLSPRPRVAAFWSPQHQQQYGTVVSRSPSTRTRLQQLKQTVHAVFVATPFSGEAAAGGMFRERVRRNAKDRRRVGT